jgi:hypothetical protein
MMATPTAAGPLPGQALPCQHDPEKWFRRGDRAIALPGCLACPHRRWFAQRALDCRATLGTWAGIWIDDNRAEVAPYLRAIADDGPAPTTNPRIEAEAAAPQLPRPRRPVADTAPTIPWSGNIGAANNRRMTARLVVTARSGCYCEIMAPGCRLTSDRLARRITDGPADHEPGPAELYASCAACTEVLACLEPAAAHRLGYSVASTAAAAATPFYWRGSRWVLLDAGGGVTDIDTTPHGVAQPLAVSA